MADNVELDAGSGGATVKTDDDGTAHWQYVKLAYGADNTQTIVGSISSNPLPVALSDVDNAVLDAIAASVAVMDDWDETNRAKVNIIAGQAGIAGGTGVDGATVPRVSLATDVALPAGTNAIGKLAANNGVDIGDVDVTSVVPGTGATNLGKAVDAVAGGSDTGVPSLVIRDDSLTTLTPADGDYTNLRVSSTGALHVTGGGGGTEYTEDAATANPIVGTATLVERDDALSTVTPIEGDWIGLRGSAEGALWTQDFNSDGILAATEATQAAVEGTLTVGSHAITNAGTFVVQEDGAALTALQKIDDVVHVDDAAFTLGSSSGVMMMGFAGTQSVNANDAGAIAMDTDGAVHISDGGNIITVDGTVTANPASGTIDTVTAVTDITNTIDATISGAALTALQLIDDPVFVDNAAFTLASSSVMVGGAIRDDTLSALAAVEGDAVPLRVGSTGALHVTGAGGGTQYNIDDAGGATDTGTLTLAIRDDSLTTLTPVDGDYVGLRVNSTGALHVTGGGGGTEYTEDVATANPIVGSATLIERDDALSTVTPVEGDWIGLRGSAEGALWTQDFNSDGILAATEATQAAVEGTLTVGAHAVTNAGTFVVQEDGAALTALQLIDDIVSTDDTTTHATGTTKGANMMAAATPTDGSVAANDIGMVAMSTDRRLHVDADITASVALDVSAATVTVDGSGVTQPVSGTVTANPASGTIDTVTTVSTVSALGTGTTGPQKAEDVASANGDIGIPAMARRTATPADTSGADLDYEMLQMDNGRLWTSATIDAAIPAGTNAIGKLSANSGVDIGDVDILSIAAGDNNIGNVDIVSGTITAVTDITNTVTVDNGGTTAPGASKQIWVYGLALTADVDGSFSIQDEDDTAHTGVMPIPANGGFVMNPSGNFAMPWFKVATNKALEIDTVTCTADGVITYAIVSV